MSEKLANPAPLGLLGFGLTTVLLNLHNAGFFPLDTMILAIDLAYAAYFFMWGLFTLGMLLGTLKKNQALQFVFASLTVLFFLLVARELTQDATIATLVGYEGIICGLRAIYLAIAEVLNETYGKTILPICPVS